MKLLFFGLGIIIVSAIGTYLYDPSEISKEEFNKQMIASFMGAGFTIMLLELKKIIDKHYEVKEI